jgi:uncharacterized Zn finger protein
MSFFGGGWPPYVTVAERREKALSQLEKLKKGRRMVSPVTVEGRLIARTFWGKQWCDALEACSDEANRLERGRSYVRNGAVLDLQITAGHITALVSGSTLYKVRIEVSELETNHWQSLVQACAGQVASCLELLQGRLSNAVMERVTHPGSGLLPLPQQMIFQCSCDDWAFLCKHVAAVLYGIGARLDSQPELLFLLRQVDPQELIQASQLLPLLEQQTAPGQHQLLESADLSALFGIDLDEPAPKEACTASLPPLERFEQPARGPASKKTPPRKRAGNC